MEQTVTKVVREGERNADKPHVSTHVLDTSRGIPADRVAVSLYKNDNDAWTRLKASETDQNGRCADLSAGSLEPGRYKIQFDVGEYFTCIKVDSLFPTVEIIFDVKSSQEHYHIPLLLSPFGFTTYRGS